MKFMKIIFDMVLLVMKLGWCYMVYDFVCSVGVLLFIVWYLFVSDCVMMCVDIKCGEWCG